MYVCVYGCVLFKLKFATHMLHPKLLPISVPFSVQYLTPSPPFPAPSLLLSVFVSQSLVPCQASGRNSTQFIRETLQVRQLPLGIQASCGTGRCRAFHFVAVVVVIVNELADDGPTTTSNKNKQHQQGEKIRLLKISIRVRVRVHRKMVLPHKRDTFPG